MDLWGNEDAEEYRARIRAEFLGEAYHFPDYEALEKAIHGCRRCPLRSEGGRGPVLSTGPSDSPLMIVGEGPGSVEDEYGGPSSDRRDNFWIKRLLPWESQETMSMLRIS